MNYFDPAVAPFTTAILIMAGVAALEIVSLLFGGALSQLIDAMLPDFDFADVEIDADGLDADGVEVDGVDAEGGASVFARFLSWLCVGKTPVLILLAAFLGGFGVVGHAAQQAAAGVFGAPAPTPLAAVVAFFGALPITRALGSTAARIMPKEETDAVSRDSFIGRLATVIRGEARRGAPAEAKLTDAAGATQYVLIEPDLDSEAFGQGADVILVARDGAVYRAIANPSPALSNA